MRFDEFDLNYDVLDALDSMRFSECTPIQERSIPVALEGRDLIAVAQTGTGKTAAYLLPVLSRLADGGFPEDAVNCIVMAPTRELAMQIDRQLEGFGYFMNISSLAIYGGTDGVTFAQQQKSLILGADIVICTPGRLLAHLQMGKIDLSRVSFFILDEADRMLDMGFYDDIMQVVKHLPKNRQTLMYSATMPPKIQQLAKSILVDPAEVKLAVSRPADKIKQRVAICQESEKSRILKTLFTEQSSHRVIVFASSKLKVKDLSKELRRAHFKIGEMHSDLEQGQRDEVMHNFKSGHIDILVATDIVARGIDIDDITAVVNYDVPHDAEDYVHRIGRTARAGAEGSALTLVGPRDRRRWNEIERFIGREHIERIVTDESSDTESTPSAERKSNGGRGRHGRGPRRGSPSGSAPRRRPKQPNPEAPIAADGPVQTPGGAGESETGRNAPQRKKRRWHRRGKSSQPGNEGGGE